MRAPLRRNRSGAQKALENGSGRFLFFLLTLATVFAFATVFAAALVFFFSGEGRFCFFFLLALAAVFAFAAVLALAAFFFFGWQIVSGGADRGSHGSGGENSQNRSGH